MLSVSFGLGPTLVFLVSRLPLLTVNLLRTYTYNASLATTASEQVGLWGGGGERGSGAIPRCDPSCAYRTPRILAQEGSTNVSLDDGPGKHETERHETEWHVPPPLPPFFVRQSESDRPNGETDWYYIL